MASLSEGVPVDRITYQVAIQRALAAKVARNSRSLYYWTACAGILEYKLKAANLWQYVDELRA